MYNIEYYYDQVTEKGTDFINNSRSHSIIATIFKKITSYPRGVLKMFSTWFRYGSILIA